MLSCLTHSSNLFQHMISVSLKSTLRVLDIRRGIIRDKIAKIIQQENQDVTKQKEKSEFLSY